MQSRIHNGQAERFVVQLAEKKERIETSTEWIRKKMPSQKDWVLAGPSYPVSRMLLMVDNKTRRKSGSVDGSMQQGESEFHPRAAQSAGDHFCRALFTQALKSCFFFQHAPIWCELRVLVVSCRGTALQGTKIISGGLQLAIFFPHAFELFEQDLRFRQESTVC